MPHYPYSDTSIFPPAGLGGVSYIKDDLRKLEKEYQWIFDALAGEQFIKAKKTEYLPMPNAHDVSPENTLRYENYVNRAVFYNVTKRTLRGLAGMVFTRDPIAELPTPIEPMIADATGGGVALDQLAKRSTSQVLAYGRSGLFVDYPSTQDAISLRDVTERGIRPIMRVYAPWEVINWRVETRGAKDLLSLVVLREKFIMEDDGFEVKYGPQWRVLRLVNQQYQVEIWRQNSGDEARIVSRYIPTDANERPFNEIPFIFIGSEDNDPTPDEAPLYDLASLNIGHYRNSADYEESCFIVGQPTPYFAGLSENWVKNVFKDRPLMLGSRRAVPLPEGGSAGLLQAEANSMPFEAMQHKERQMVALGAKLIEQRNVQRTAREAEIETVTETSTLMSAAKNVTQAYNQGLQWAQQFATSDVDNEAIKFELNTELDLVQLTPQERTQLVEEWVKEAITFSEMRDNLRRAGIATLEDDKAREEIQRDRAEFMNDQDDDDLDDIGNDDTNAGFA